VSWVVFNGNSFFEIALTLYFAGFLLSISELVRKKTDFEKIIFILCLSGFVLHTVYLAVRYIISGQAPVFSMHEATSFLPGVSYHSPYSSIIFTEQKF